MRIRSIPSLVARQNKPTDLKPKRHKLVILLPMVWSIRNIVHSGLLDLLPGVDVHLLIHQYDPGLLPLPFNQAFSSAASCQALQAPEMKQRVFGMAFLKEIIKSAFSRRNAIGSYPIYQHWNHRNSTFFQRLRIQMVELLGFLAQPAPFFFGLCRISNYLYPKSNDLTPIRQQLNEIQPDLLLSTVNVESTYERAYILAAKELGIPIVISILSFDNLTTHPIHLLYDHYLVWNQGMRDQLLRLYPQVTKDQVRITGTPQFDFHRRPACLWTREYTLQHLGLPPNAEYFLYGTSVEGLTPAEPELVARIAKKIQEHDILKNYWLVVRIHPRDDWSRWDGVRRSSSHVVLSKAWDVTPNSSGWALPTMDDHARLTSSLVHATACINIASTISLDAAILDRPVIGIRFDKEPDAPPEILYEEYDTDHYRPLVELGGLRLAHTWDELLDLMQQAIEHPDRDRDARARMVSQECGMVDGKAAERVANALLDILHAPKITKKAE